MLWSSKKVKIWNWFLSHAHLNDLLLVRKCFYFFYIQSIELHFFPFCFCAIFFYWNFHLNSCWRQLLSLLISKHFTSRSIELICSVTFSGLLNAIAIAYSIKSNESWINFNNALERCKWWLCPAFLLLLELIYFDSMNERKYRRITIAQCGSHY